MIMLIEIERGGDERSACDGWLPRRRGAVALVLREFLGEIDRCC